MRYLTILMLLLVGLPRVGVGIIGMQAQTGCTETVCQPVVVQVSCCGLETPAQDMDEYCPMSGGACRCGVSPADEPERGPKAPLQRSENQITLGLSFASVHVQSWKNDRDACSVLRSGLIANLVSLRTHNETQALLGVWRT